MTIVRVIIAACLIVIFVLVASFNWFVFWRGFVRRQKAPSWIPLVAAFAGAAALFIVPTEHARPLAWLPLLLDFGALPGLLLTAVLLFRAR